jgi:hypothetical protein
VFRGDQPHHLLDIVERAPVASQMSSPAAAAARPATARRLDSHPLVVEVSGRLHKPASVASDAVQEMTTAHGDDRPLSQQR